MKDYLFDGPINDSTIVSILNYGNEDLHAGAYSLFIGRVRADDAGGKSVTAIEYSAYPEMVASQAEDIILSVKNLYPDVRDIIFLHSTGVVKAGEISLVIKVSAGHRAEAMKACSATLEKIKEQLPVWKKEFFNDQSSSWRHS